MSVLRAASSISALTLVSRVLGLCRDMAMAAVFGVSWISGTFTLAWMLPNLLRRLFGEGALSAAFVPAFAKTLEREGPPAARSLLAHVAGGVVAATGALTVLCVLGAVLVPPEWFALGGDGVGPGERGALLWQLGAILIGYSVPICLLATYSGALNALGVFALPAAAPIVLNVLWLATLGLCAWLGLDDLQRTARTIAIALLGGGVLQLLLGAVPLYRRRMLSAPRSPVGNPRASSVFRAMVPAAVGLSVVQLNLLVDQVLAEYLVGPGANMHLYLANRLLLFPHSLVTLPLAVAVFPTLSRLALERDASHLTRQLERAVSVTQFVALPAMVGLVVLVIPTVQVLFEAGRYTAEDTVWTAWTTAALIAGLPFIGTTQLLARALFALDDPRTPARISAVLVVANVALNLAFVLGAGLGVAGFALATTTCAAFNVAALHRALSRRGIVVRWSITAALRTAVCTAAMAALVWFARDAFAAETRLEKAVFHLAIPIAVGIASYLGASLLLRSPELTELARRLFRR